MGEKGAFGLIGDLGFFFCIEQFFGSLADTLFQPNILLLNNDGIFLKNFLKGLIKVGILPSIIILIILISIPLHSISQQPFLSKALLYSFLIFWFLTVNHSAMRVAFPGFIYGLSLIRIIWNEEDPLSRK